MSLNLLANEAIMNLQSDVNEAFGIEKEAHFEGQLTFTSEKEINRSNITKNEIITIDKFIMTELTIADTYVKKHKKIIFPF